MNKYTILFLSFLIHSSLAAFAIIHADYPEYANDVVEKVSPLVGGNVDVISAQTSTPLAGDIAKYDAVLVYSNFAFSDSVALGNLLADYVDQGKGVVIAVFGIVTYFPNSYPRGRFIGSGTDYYAITPGSRQYSPALDLVAVNTTHEILKGVEKFNGGADSFRSSGDIVKGATLIATWSNKSPLIATREINGTRRADLNFFPVSDDVVPGFWDSDTDGAELIANSLIWVSNSRKLA